VAAFVDNRRRKGGVAVNLFAYGTLVDPRVIARVTGRSFPASSPAVLQGYVKRQTVFGYPALFPDPNRSVDGVVYYSLTDADWKRLDEYEGLNASPPHYYRRLVAVLGTYGTIRSHVYVGNPLYFGTRLLPD
jgi:gamma-glutamylcyclotransferase (GGCT)/AIG2-like uncharacterized protein YtfP